jgi:predicted dehydrogenase
MICDSSGKWRLVLCGYTDWFEQQVIELREFLNCIVEDREPFIPGEQGRKSLEMVMSIYKSSELGQLVRLPLKE